MTKENFKKIMRNHQKKIFNKFRQETLALPIIYAIKWKILFPSFFHLKIFPFRFIFARISVSVCVFLSNWLYFFTCRRVFFLPSHLGAFLQFFFFFLKNFYSSCQWRLLTRIYHKNKTSNTQNIIVLKERSAQFRWG